MKSAQAALTQQYILHLHVNTSTWMDPKVTTVVCGHGSLASISTGNKVRGTRATHVLSPRLLRTPVTPSNGKFSTNGKPPIYVNKFGHICKNQRQM